jgi:hypothetical protein
VLTRLVRQFYAHLEVVQNDDNGIVLQSYIAGHVIIVDPQVISQSIMVLVLQISTSQFNDIVLAPSLDELCEFFQSRRARSEPLPSVLVLSPSHRMLAKIVQHNL